VVVALDLGDELRDVVVLGDARRSDLLAVAVETADKANLRQKVLGAVAGRSRRRRPFAGSASLAWPLSP
jgi:hypothetical protein